MKRRGVGDISVNDYQGYLTDRKKNVATHYAVARPRLGEDFNNKNKQLTVIIIVSCYYFDEKN